MKTFLAVSALLFTLASAQSSAGVIYEWKGVDEQARAISLKMEFDLAAVESGKLEIHVPYQDKHAPPLDIGLISLRFAGANTYAYFDRQPSVSGGRIDMNVTFEPSGFLNGYFALNDTNTEVSMNSSKQFWNISLISSDYLGAGYCGRGNYPDCDLGRGMIRRTDIPEPGSAALLGFGLAAAFAASRRKKL